MYDHSAKQCILIQDISNSTWKLLYQRVPNAEHQNCLENRDERDIGVLTSGGDVRPPQYLSTPSKTYFANESILRSTKTARPPKTDLGTSLSVLRGNALLPQYLQDLSSDDDANGTTLTNTMPLSMLETSSQSFVLSKGASERLILSIKSSLSHPRIYFHKRPR